MSEKETRLTMTRKMSVDFLKQPADSFTVLILPRRFVPALLP